KMFETLYPKLEPGGLLVFDNVFSNGLVVVPDEQFERRQRTMVRRLREFLDMITAHPNLETTVVPLGDGLTVSIKK
ncbi:O-methyltransferase, partial [bacterium]